MNNWQFLYMRYLSFLVYKLIRQYMPITRYMNNGVMMYQL